MAPAPAVVAEPDFSNCARWHFRGAQWKDLDEIYASVCPEVDQAWSDFYFARGASIWPGPGYRHYNKRTLTFGGGKNGPRRQEYEGSALRSFWKGRLLFPNRFPPLPWGGRMAAAPL